MYQALREVAQEPPRTNERYRIYNFFARDPDGRLIEFQHFLHDLPALEVAGARDRALAADTEAGTCGG
jgi:hypothetical protein